MSTTVVAVSSRQPRENEPYYRPGVFTASLRRFGVEPVILGLNEPWGGLMSKPAHFLKWLSAPERKPDERVILSDCWDVIFADHPDNISARIADAFGGSVVFNTEKSCWPLAELAKYFDDEGTPWRYLNGGVMHGRVADLRVMFESMGLEAIGLDREEDGRRIEPNDAVPLVMAYVNQPVTIRVDAKCRVFQCFSESSAEEFDIDATGVKNKLTGTRPGILHFNGGSKNELMPQVMAAMGL